MKLIYFIPLATFTLSIAFSYFLLVHFRSKKSATYILWWLIGVLTYGAGTLTESINTLFGWHELNFRLWYITGALLGGAPLAQGSVYLFLNKRIAHVLSAILVTTVTTAAVCVLLSPIHYDAVVPERMTGGVFVWQWVRYFSPFINLYAVIFLAGGAIASAWKYYQKTGSGNRFRGNVLIAIGAILPGIGGSFTRMGYVEVLYVTEFIGLSLIMWAYFSMKSDNIASIHVNQQIAQ